MEEVMERIKKHEGFRDRVYLDTLGKRTIGYGHLCKPDETWDDDRTYSKAELETVFKTDFNIALNGANTVLAGCGDVPQKAKEIIIEMVFQLGMTGVSKFKNMIKGIKNKDWKTASIEMLDSRWAKQTPSRAKELSKIMGEV